MIARHVKIRRLGDPRDEAVFWRDRPAAERIGQVESLRAEYHAWKEGHAEPGFQRVCRRIKRLQG